MAGMLALLAAGVCVRLGFWQLDRMEQRQTRNQAIEAAAQLPPIKLDAAAVAAIQRDPAAFVHRRVRARGEFLPERDIVLRGRARQGRPGVHLVAPLRLEDVPATVLVERGWVASPDALGVAPARFSEPGTQTVEGVLGEIATGGDPGQAVQGTVLRLDLPTLRSQLPGVLLPLRIQQLGPPATVAGLERIAPPELDAGPHLGYAIQWFSFAAIAVIGFSVAVWRRAR